MEGTPPCTATTTTRCERLARGGRGEDASWQAAKHAAASISDVIPMTLPVTIHTHTQHTMNSASALPSVNGYTAWAFVEPAAALLCLRIAMLERHAAQRMPPAWPSLADVIPLLPLFPWFPFDPLLTLCTAPSPRCSPCDSFRLTPPAAAPFCSSFPQHFPCLSTLNSPACRS